MDCLDKTPVEMDPTSVNEIPVKTRPAPRNLAIRCNNCLGIFLMTSAHGEVPSSCPYCGCPESFSVRKGLLDSLWAAERYFAYEERGQPDSDISDYI